MWPFSNSKLEQLSEQLDQAKSEIATLSASVTATTSDHESMMEMFITNHSVHGETVTRETAMKVASVYACVRLICGTIGTLPAHIYTRDGGHSSVAKDHPYYHALHDEPNPMITSVIFWEAIVNHMLIEGNAYALIGRNRNGDMLSLTLLGPDRVEPNPKNGRLAYSVLFDDGTMGVYDQDDILHVPNIGWDGRRGLSTLRSAMLNSVGGALASDNYSGSFFKNDATPRGYIRFPEGVKVDNDQAKIVRDYWFEHHQSTEKRHLPAFIPQGGEFKEVTMSAEDTQLLQTRLFQVADVARVFGVPPHMIGHLEKTSSWGSGIEQMSMAFAMFTLRPILSRIEKEVNRKILRNRSFFFKFNLDGLQRGDIKTRYDAYQKALGGNQYPGFMTKNEVRKLEDLPPQEGGDELYTPILKQDNNLKKEDDSDV